MIKVSLDTAILLIIIVAVLVGISQYGMPKIAATIEQMLVDAAETK